MCYCKSKEFQAPKKTRCILILKNESLATERKKEGYNVCMKQPLLSKVHTRPALSCFTDHIDRFFPWLIADRFS